MKSETKGWMLLAVLACIWGSSFILMKKGMFTASGEVIFSDVQVASLRMLFASIALLPMAIRAFRRIKSFRDLILLVIVGFFGNYFPAYLFTYAELGLSSSYTGMLNSCTPIFALLIGFVIFKDRLTRIQLLGVLIGTIGIVLLSIAGQDLELSGDWRHVFAVVLASMCYGISLNTIKYTLQGYTSIDITSMAFFTVLLPSVVVTFTSGTLETIQINDFAVSGLIYILVLSLVGTAFAVILFNQLIASSSVLFASSVTYLIPIVAVIIGVSVGEKIGIYQLLSMVIVLLGVFIANYLPKLNWYKSRYNG
ncbi:MAG: DMT family transporter [Crocinitomicaceae bacterium]|nr:DMT family transporter [Crocinitomicaceae bacterium]